LHALQQRHPQLIEAVQGMGLMLAIKLATPQLANALQEACFRSGVLVLGAGDRSVRVSPPLVISEGLMAQGLDVMAEALDALERTATASTTLG